MDKVIDRNLDVCGSSVLDSDLDSDLYSGDFSAAILLLKERIEQEKVNFLLSVNPILDDGAKLAYLLDCLINQHFQPRINYKSFFCNSSNEALHGSIKLGKVNYPHRHKVMIFDEVGQDNPFLNQLSTSDICVYPAMDGLYDEIDGDVYLVIIRLSDGISLSQLNQCQKKCVEKGLLFAIDSSNIKMAGFLSYIDSLSVHPDIVLWGEEFTNDTVPFGAFTYKENLSKPWNSLAGCFMHSSTYGGNGLAMDMACRFLLKQMAVLRVDEVITNKLQEISQSKACMFEMFCKHVNKMSPYIFKAASLDLNVKRASGSVLVVEDEQCKSGQRTVIDAVGGCGCSLRGHNNQDIIDDVLNKHRSDVDYWKNLESLLCDVTGLPHVFPAVSGATSVDIGLMLALQASQSKKKILTFRGNYSGKTLFSLSVTMQDDARKPFESLVHRDVETIDLGSDHILEAVEEYLNDPDLALIWFENIQGKELNNVPPSLQRLIAEHQASHHYYVGIDEVLNGCYRTGCFLSYDTALIKPDIITLSKGLSDMVFPVAATCISDRLYRSTENESPQIVKRLACIYKNQLGAHIALHALQAVKRLNIGKNVEFVSAILHEGLTDVSKRRPLMLGIKGKGLHIHICSNYKKFPFVVFGKQMSDLIVSNMCYKESGVLIFFGRLLPALTLDETEARQIVAAIDNVYAKSSWSIFVTGVGIMSRLIVDSIKQSFKRY